MFGLGNNIIVDIIVRIHNGIETFHTMFWRYKHQSNQWIFLEGLITKDSPKYWTINKIPTIVIYNKWHRKAGYQSEPGKVIKVDIIDEL